MVNKSSNPILWQNVSLTRGHHARFGLNYLLLSLDGESKKIIRKRCYSRRKGIWIWWEFRNGCEGEELGRWKCSSSDENALLGQKKTRRWRLDEMRGAASECVRGKCWWVEKLWKECWIVALRLYFQHLAFISRESSPVRFSFSSKDRFIHPY